MRSDEGFIEVGEDFLERAFSHQYDPEKAHQYYMLNRQLKGRQNNAIKKAPKIDSIRQFSPTLSDLLKNGKRIINLGNSFINKLFGR